MNKPVSLDNEPNKPDIPVVFSKALANIFGPEAALVLQQTHYMTGVFASKEDNRINGYFWYRHAYADWHADYPFWSAATFKLAISKLEKAGILVGAQLSNNKFDKGKWYRIDYDRLNEFIPSADSKLFFDGNLPTNRLDGNRQSSDAKSPHRVETPTPSSANFDPSVGTTLPVERLAASRSKNKNSRIENHSPDLPNETHSVNTQKMDRDSSPTPHPAEISLVETEGTPSRSEGQSETSSSSEISHDEAKEMAREIYNFGPLRGLVSFCLMPELSGVKPGPREWKRLRKVLNEIEAMTPSDVPISSELFEVDFRLWWFMYGPGQDGEPIRVAEYLPTVWPRFLAHHRQNRNWVMEFGVRHAGWLAFCKQDPQGFAELYAAKNRDKRNRPSFGPSQLAELSQANQVDEDAILEAMICEASV
ncbi:MAG: hypothetical protein BroJett018_51620 [Chloroflexota bacterium]|nr:hypothetical protein [Chloroflexota bacterium]NOG66021.1 hypothetical protein [Chloroflexota bacterium]GIK67368.1 MAG: hypothetical protein BroJett018_51620 [Chloroflexota bacterium]